MKAVEINGNIKVYSKLPKSWNNIIGGFDLLSDSELESYGFYDLISPEFNIKTQELSNIVFDSESNAYKYIINNLTWSETLTELKNNKIDELKVKTNAKLASTDWYVIRNLERNIDIPQDIQDERSSILTLHDEQIDEINSLTKKADVVNYEFR